MTEAKRREAWQHTSAILATLANIHRDPKKKPRPYSQDDFNPTSSSSQAAALVKADITVLKRVFVDRSR